MGLPPAAVPAGALRTGRPRARPDTLISAELKGPRTLLCFFLLLFVFWFWPVLGRFSAELGPETRSKGSGSKDGAERPPN